MDFGVNIKKTISPQSFQLKQKGLNMRPVRLPTAFKKIYLHLHQYEKEKLF